MTCLVYGVPAEHLAGYKAALADAEKVADSMRRPALLAALGRHPTASPEAYPMRSLRGSIVHGMMEMWCASHGFRLASLF